VRGIRGDILKILPAGRQKRGKEKMKWLLWFLAGIVVVVLAALLVFKGPNLKQYEILKNPRIITKPNTTVLEVSFDVNYTELSKVFKVLMKNYFKLKGVPKGLGMPAPVARYENIKPNKPMDNKNWKGAAAIPISGAVLGLTEPVTEPGLTPKLSQWKYGEVAEILHRGPYNAETPTIKKLTDYIQKQGYEIVGLHEEEYLRGPGMLIPGDPKKYYTIIRYQVKKVEKK
jgi:effector-binding domain-containing protein